MCVLARGGDFCFLKCILPGHCQSVNKSRQRKVAVGNYISQLQQAPQGGKLKNKRFATAKNPPELDRKDGEGSHSTCFTIVNHFSEEFLVKLPFFSPIPHSFSRPYLHNVIGPQRDPSRLDNEEHVTVLVYVPHFFCISLQCWRKLWLMGNREHWTVPNTHCLKSWDGSFPERHACTMFPLFLVSGTWCLNITRVRFKHTLPIRAYFFMLI